jgi:hypothetical protein
VEAVKPFKTVRRVAEVRAAGVSARGGRVSRRPSIPVAVEVAWDVSGSCSDPVELAGRLGKAGRPLPGSTVTALVRCRRCPACLGVRADRWGRAAAVERERAPRTWFGCLTFAPEARLKLHAATRARVARGGAVLEDMEPDEQIGQLHQEAVKVVSAFLKAIRKGSGWRTHGELRFRYLLVVESDADVFPRYQVLIHEVSESAPVRKTALVGLWSHGSARWGLAGREFPIIDAVKSLSMFPAARVRASENYGDEARVRACV